MSASICSERVQLRSGAIAHYARSGESGPPVVLLHGGLPGASGEAGWRFMLPALAEAGFRAYAPDRPGFGKADTREPYVPKLGWLSHLEFLSQFVDAVCLDTFCLGGNSMGATLAALFAVGNPHRVERLALVASNGLNQRLRVDASMVRRHERGVNQFDGTMESMRATLLGIMHHPDSVTDELVERRYADAVRQEQCYEAAMSWNRSAESNPDFVQLLNLEGRLDRITIPTIYLYGAQDAMSPVENAYLQEDKLPNVQFFYPQDCGHQGQTDQPEMFNAVFCEFFGTGKVSPQTAVWAGISDRRAPLQNIVSG